MVVETGRKRLTPAPHLGRRYRVLSVAKTNPRPQASSHTYRHSLHHPPRRHHDVSSSRLRSPHIPLLCSPFLGVPPTLLLLTRVTAFTETSLSGKVLNFGQVWSAQGQHIFGIANNELSVRVQGCLFLFLCVGRGWTMGASRIVVSYRCNYCIS